MIKKYLTVGLALALFSLPALATASDRTKGPPMRSLSKPQIQFLRTAVGTLNKAINKARKLNSPTAKTMLSQLTYERSQLIKAFNSVRRSGNPLSMITINGGARHKTASISNSTTKFVLTEGFFGDSSFTVNRPGGIGMPIGTNGGAIQNPSTTIKVQPSIWGKSLEMKYRYNNMDYTKKGQPVMAGSITTHTLSIKAKPLDNKQSWKRNTVATE